MKKLTRPLSSLLLFAVLLSVCALVLSSCGAAGNYRLSYDHADSYTAGNLSTADKIRTLDIEWPAGRVEIRSYVGSDVRVEDPDGDGVHSRMMHTRKDGDALTVKEYESDVSVSGNKAVKTLFVYLPETGDDLELDALTVKTADASVRVDSIGTKALTLESASGRLSIYGVATEAKLSTLSGDVDLYLESDDLEIETEAGAIDGSIVAKKAAVRADAGSVTLAGSYDVLTLSLTAASADIQAKGDELTVTSVSSEIAISGDATALKIDTGAGKCTLTGKFETLDYNSATAPLTVTTASLPKNIRYVSSSGDFFMTAPAEQIGCRATFESVSGQMNAIDPETSHDGENEYRYGNFVYPYTFKTTTGNVTIRLEPPKDAD